MVGVSMGVSFRWVGVSCMWAYPCKLAGVSTTWVGVAQSTYPMARHWRPHPHPSTSKVLGDTDRLLFLRGSSYLKFSDLWSQGLSSKESGQKGRPLMWMQELMRLKTINEFLKQMSVSELIVGWKQIHWLENLELRLKSSISPPVVVLRLPS